VTAYLQFGPIHGDATLAALGHDHWININSFEWKIDWAVTTRAKLKDSARDSKHPTIGEFTISKETDRATTGLLDAITRQKLSNPKGETCKIRFLTTGSGQHINQMIIQEFIFHESLITEMSFSSKGDRPSETIKINFTAVEMKVWPTPESNTKEAPLSFPCFPKINN
jgi:type VI protein secretion system component Hcp